MAVEECRGRSISRTESVRFGDVEDGAADGFAFSAPTHDGSLGFPSLLRSIRVVLCSVPKPVRQVVALVSQEVADSIALETLGLNGGLTPSRRVTAT